MCVLSTLSTKDRYGLEIIQTVKDESNIKLILGSLYNILHKLEKEGLAKSYWGEETDERGGNRRKYYRITAKGERTLKEAQLGLVRLWGGQSFLQKLFPDLKLDLFRGFRFVLLSLLFLTVSLPTYADTGNWVESFSSVSYAPLVIFLGILGLLVLVPLSIKIVNFLYYRAQKPLEEEVEEEVKVTVVLGVVAIVVGGVLAVVVGKEVAVGVVIILGGIALGPGEDY